MHHRFPIKKFGNDGGNEIQSVNRAMKGAYNVTTSSLKYSGASDSVFIFLVLNLKDDL